MRPRRARSVFVVIAAAPICFAALLSAQAPLDTFTGTASLEKGAAQASAPFKVTVTRYASMRERDELLAAVRKDGNAGARKLLETAKDAGVIELGEQRVAIKFASQRPTASGRLITVVTATPMMFVGGAAPNAKPRPGFDLALALLDLQESGGMGELAPAAKIGVTHDGAIVTEDYGATVIWLQGLAALR